MMIHMMTMKTALRCFLLDDDALLFVSASLGGCVLSFMEYYRYKSFVFFSWSMYTKELVNMFFVRPPKKTMIGICSGKEATPQ